MQPKTKSIYIYDGLQRFRVTPMTPLERLCAPFSGRPGAIALCSVCYPLYTRCCLNSASRPKVLLLSLPDIPTLDHSPMPIPKFLFFTAECIQVLHLIASYLSVSWSAAFADCSTYIHLEERLQLLVECASTLSAHNACRCLKINPSQVLKVSVWLMPSSMA